MSEIIYNADDQLVFAQLATVQHVPDDVTVIIANGKRYVQERIPTATDVLDAIVRGRKAWELPVAGVRVSADIDTKWYLLLREYAEAEQVTTNEVVRRAVCWFLDGRTE